MAPLWSLSCRITSPGAENCLAAPCQWVQCLGEDPGSTRSRGVQAALFSGGYLARGTCAFGLKAFLHSSLKPLKKIFSTANYKALPALSLNTGLDHCTLHWFLLRVHSSESERGQAPVAKGRSRPSEKLGGEVDGKGYSGVVCSCGMVLREPKGAMSG